MRDLEKSGQIKGLCAAIISVAECYETASDPIYFDYENMIALLEQAQILQEESARCPRPANLPVNIPWCEKLHNGDEMFNPMRLTAR